MSMDKSDRDSNPSILKSTSIFSLGTLASRILGFVRDVILARVFGTTSSADSFFVAFRLPNLWRDLMGEGAVNSAVVPVLAEYADPNQKDKTALGHLAGVIFVLCTIVLSVICLLGILLAPGIVRLMAPGFIMEPEKLNLTIRLTRLLFPYLILIGLTAYSMGILLTLRSFFWPAFSPCLLNVAMIIAAFWASQTMGEPIVGLAAGVLAGGVAQLWFQMRALKKLGMRWVWPKTLIHPGARKIGKLLLPRLVGSGIYQLNVFVDTLCASLATIVGPGGVSAIYYANRIVQFPQGIFGVALASAVLPSLSSFAVKEDWKNLKTTLVFSLKNIFLIMLPVSLMCFLLAVPMIRVLFERGEFTSYSTQITANALLFYSLGLWAYGGQKIITSGFFALQDTRTPVKVGALSFLVNAVLDFLLIGPLQVGGIALASSIAVSLNFLILFFLMDQRLTGLKEEMRGFMARLTLASLGMAAVVIAGLRSGLVLSEPLRLLGIGLLGCVSFVFLAWMLKLDGVTGVMQWVFRRKSAPTRNPSRLGN